MLRSVAFLISYMSKFLARVTKKCIRGASKAPTALGCRGLEGTGYYQGVSYTYSPLEEHV
jgi:hypothetical protein